ncbi:enoyl-CoA hydratase/isomerase family protein [Bradyrhizobium sp. CCBAU 51753]|uniref:enoyl-CoA hydratase/isomerase family protein n=1 Tax=Bradyrhizobium sp. CCBAU 51753 TaxID=1325100 RepID=UPI00188D381B|nr:enoyl-CoA hydratase/isomerase family protein [Bradyrhizobium sp. CCBAU 51753]QOZ23849.1 enoyl-CoA hydratase/isomerase family protein [Bradyrhizobium sp. CCBAU 51753]
MTMQKGKKFPFHPDDLLSEIRDGVLVLTINRQARCNAWTEAMREELMRKLLAADEDANAEAIVLTGAGPKAFCAGQDLGETSADIVEVRATLDRFASCYDAVRNFSKPLVAAVNGVAAGSGFQLAQLCDYVVAHPNVRMGQTEVKAGLPSIFGLWLMWERIGSRAYELSLQGRLMEAKEAKHLGFINEIVDEAGVLDAAVDVARRLAKQPRLAFRISKTAIRCFDEERYQNAWKVAFAAYREAFESGALEKEVQRFFENRGVDKF